MCGRIQNSVGSTALKGALVAVMMRVKHPEERIKLQALSVSSITCTCVCMYVLVFILKTHICTWSCIHPYIHLYSLTCVAPRILCDQLR